MLTQVSKDVSTTQDQDIKLFLNLLSALGLELLMEELEGLEEFKAQIALYKSNAKLIFRILTISGKKQDMKGQEEQVETLIKKLVGQAEE